MEALCVSLGTPDPSLDINGKGTPQQEEGVVSGNCTLLHLSGGAHPLYLLPLLCGGTGSSLGNGQHPATADSNRENFIMFRNLKIEHETKGQDSSP